MPPCSSLGAARVGRKLLLGELDGGCLPLDLNSNVSATVWWTGRVPDDGVVFICHQSVANRRPSFHCIVPANGVPGANGGGANSRFSHWPLSSVRFSVTLGA